MEPITNFETQNLIQNTTPIPPQKNIFKILFFILLTLVLIGISVFATLLITKKQNLVQVETPTPTAIPTIADESANWKTYTDSKLGFSFQYPIVYGDIKITNEKGDTGSLYRGVFDKNENLSFGGNSLDYSLGRGNGFLDFSGYTKVSNSIKFNTQNNNSSPIKSSAIKKIYLNKNGIEIVLISGYEDEGYPSPSGLGLGNIGVLINTKSNTYPGVAFKASSKISESELSQILDTFKFN